MRYAEIRRDLFNVPLDQYKLAHCVSADLEMGAGIAKEIVIQFSDEVKILRSELKNELKEEGRELESYVGKTLAVPAKLGKFNVYHLVTKERYWEKPTYESLALALHHLRKRCLIEKVGKLAMPTIGCGLDGLEWSKVSKIIQGIFSDTEIDIVICHWR